MLISISVYAFYNSKSNIDSTKTEIKSESVITKDLKVNIFGENNNSKEYQIDIKENESAFDVLKRLDSENENFTFGYKEFSFGPFVTSINNYEPDYSKQFWSFELNGKQSEVGIGDYKVKKRDTLTFKLTNIE